MQDSRSPAFRLLAGIRKIIIHPRVLKTSPNLAIWRQFSTGINSRDAATGAGRSALLAARPKRATGIKREGRM